MDILVPEQFHQKVDDTTRSFKVVFIPADVDVTIKEEVVPQLADRALSAMLDYAKSHFAKQMLSGENREKYKSKLAKEHAGITEEAVAQLADMTLCEVVPLLQNNRTSFFTAVNLVVDDKGVSKDSPINYRASAVCTRCGLLNYQVRGDAFLCRQFDNDEGFYRLDFTLEDLNGKDALWIELASMIRLQDNSVQKLTALAKQYKEKGNHEFKEQHYINAISSYRQALSVLPKISENQELRSQILSNESCCYLKIGKLADALADADACLSIRPNWNKAHGRRAAALHALNRTEEADEEFRKAGLS